MPSIAVSIICKTPSPGTSKTRLSPPLRPEECAEISACFIRDLSSTIAALANADTDVAPYALYTPRGSEESLRQLLPSGFDLVLQRDGDFGERLHLGIADLLELGHSGAIAINSDSPTLPLRLLRDAVSAVRGGQGVVLSPALDGGYTLIGLNDPHPELFEDVPWSTGAVLETTLRRAREIALPVVKIGAWYDVDDATSFSMLEAELGGTAPPFVGEGSILQDAPNTRRFLQGRRGIPSRA